tara:strand:+ start:894 stop:998 length:105 start_codon:yes stop_codon:yes gene_type:complete
MIIITAEAEKLIFMLYLEKTQTYVISKIIKKMML